MLRSVRFWILIVLLGLVAWLSFARHSSPDNTPDRAQDSAVLSPAQTSETESFSTTGTSITSFSEPASASTAATQPAAEEVFDEEPVMNASSPFISDRKVAEITEKLRILSDICPDLIGWIFMADSEIDYPVVQGSDNQFYLCHAPDGSDNQIGSIFLDRNCAKDLSSPQNILYGHNMQSGMFGDIRRFKEREEFDKHRYGWFFTPDTLYRIDFFSLAIVSAYDSMYDVPFDTTKWNDDLIEKSLYYSDTDISEDDKLISLSTCASDFEDARALFTGKLVRVQSISLYD